MRQKNRRRKSKVFCSIPPPPSILYKTGDLQYCSYAQGINKLDVYKIQLQVNYTTVKRLVNDIYNFTIKI